MDDQVGLIDVIVIAVIAFLVFWYMFGPKVMNILKRLKPAPCELEQRSDQMCCWTCMKTWDMNDPHPPVCKRMK